MLTFSTGSPTADVTRFGFTHEIVVTPEGDPAPVVSALLADPDVAPVPQRPSAPPSRRSAAVRSRCFSRTVHGRPPGLVLAEGAPPDAPDEIALGPVERPVPSGKPDHAHRPGGRSSARLTVTGLAFVPESGQTDYGTGGRWLTPAGYDRLFDEDQYRFIGVHLKPGTSGTGLAAAVGPRGLVEPAPEPAEIMLLRDLRWPPAVVAAFLALLAFGAAAHTLTATGRRRELAVLRALGLTPRQTRLTVTAQSVVIALTGLVAGLPLGVAAGRARVAGRQPDHPAAVRRPDDLDRRAPGAGGPGGSAADEPVARPPCGADEPGRGPQRLRRTDTTMPSTTASSPSMTSNAGLRGSRNT